MQQQPRLPLWFLIANPALMIAAFAMGTYVGSGRRVQLPEPQRTALELVHREILQSHIEPPNSEELVERAIGGMVDDLDEYSRYIPPKSVARYDEASSGQYSGIGAVITELGDEVVVHFPFVGSPAEAAGLAPGDVLLAVGQEQIDTPAERREVAALVRGAAGSPVELTVRRGDAVLPVQVVRGDVQRPCVKWAHFVDEDRGIGYVYLADFHPTASQQLFDAVRSLESQRPLSGLVVDLRFDGGGSLEQCLAIARGFLREGVIATQHRRDGPDEVYEARPEDVLWPDLPLALLVNEGSASASEVLSGALQDHERAAVVGVRTHGKGYVNTVYAWPDYEFKLKLTTGSYRTPNGRNIERNHSTDATPADAEEGGILPDVQVAVTEEESSRLYTLLHQIQVPDKYRAAFLELAAQHELPVAAPPRPEADAQLQAAVASVRDQLRGR